MTKKKKPNFVHNNNQFHVEFRSDAQKMAYNAFQEHDVLFLIGPAGVGKTYISMSFAINELLQKRKNRIVLTRPIVEAGEKLGYLPGEFDEKVAPYMAPLYDCIGSLVGYDGIQRELVDNSLVLAPVAYLRGRTFTNSVCIFDEAQNATISQLKLFLTRFSDNSKIIITGDPCQSDISNSGLMEVVRRLENLNGIGIIKFNNQNIVRHPLVGQILDKLED